MYNLNELTKELVAKHFKNHRGMDIKTKSGTQYHIIKGGNKYYCFSWYCNNPRELTKAMKRVFC